MSSEQAFSRTLSSKINEIRKQYINATAFLLPLNEEKVLSFLEEVEYLIGELEAELEWQDIKKIHGFANHNLKQKLR